MTATAVFFLILSVVVIWGGLLVSIARLRYDGRRGDAWADGGELAGTGDPAADQD